MDNKSIRESTGMNKKQFAEYSRSLIGLFKTGNSETEKRRSM